MLESTIPNNLGMLTNLSKCYSHVDYLIVSQTVSQFLNYISIADILLRFDLLLIATFPMPIRMPICCYCYTFKSTGQLNLHANNFIGTVPNEICALTSMMLSELTADCTNSSPVTCACCTQCYPSVPSSPSSEPSSSSSLTLTPTSSVPSSSSEPSSSSSPSASSVPTPIP
jgi:hypothetical protein